MNTEIPQDKWEEICSGAHVVTNSNTWREFKRKVIMRFLPTPEIVAKMGPIYSNTCWRKCGTHIENHTHIFWSCRRLGTFWKEIFEALEEIFHQNIAKDSRVALLGLIPLEFEGTAKNIFYKYY